MSEQLIHKQMVAILRDVDFIGKTEKNQAQGFNFRGIDQVFNELHGTFAKHGVYVRPVVLEHNHIERTTKSGGIALHHFVRVQFNFTAEDGSSTEMLGIGEAADNGDKGVSKCLSISMKYALLQAFLIPTKEDKDPDASATEWAKGKRGKPQEPEPEGVQRNTPEQQAALAQQRIAETKAKAAATKPATTSDFKMLKAFQDMKVAIGEKDYYRILGLNGYDKSNQIPDHETGTRIYKEMGEFKKERDMRRDDPATAEALFDKGAPSASLKDPR